MALEPDSTFSFYEIGDSLGVGGMGEVYRATDTKLKREVAIKVLPDSFAEDADRLARFQREAETLASLNHPNIGMIFGLEQEGDATAIVMELVEGPTLADRIADGPIQPEEALRIAKQIIDGLEAAHDQGIVHRDLKPANIKVKADGLVKILDFGIAKPIDIMGSSGNTPTMVTPAVTEAGVIMGTAAYMSPEQAQGKFVDQRTDIWAFGCLLFEMLTGQPVFTGENVMITLARILDREADLQSIPGMVSPSVRHTLKLCLEKDPARRLHHIGDVRLGLEGALDTGIPAATGQAAKPANWMLPVAGMVVASALSVAMTLLLVRDSDEEPQVAEIRRSLFTMPGDQSFTLPAIPAVNIANDGSRLVYTANAGIYVRGMDELESRLLAGTENDGAVVPVFSPDGRTIAYGSSASGEFKTVSVEGGTPLPVLPEFPSNGWTWSGDRIVFGDENNIMEINPSGGEPVLLVEEDSGALPMEPARIPGTDLVLYERRTGTSVDEGAVTVADVNSGERTRLFPGRQPKYLEEGYIVYFEPTLGIMARTFDPATLAFGPPIVMVSDILYRQGVGGVQWRVAENGTLLYEKGEIGGSEGDRVYIADENRIERELELPPAGYGFPAVSPDGTQLAWQNQLNIYIYDLDGGSEPRQITRDGQSFHPAWTPDGDYITYAADRDGAYQIWRQRADGSGVPEALTEATTAEQLFPTWAPDGRLAFTMTSEGGDLDVWIQSLPLGEPELLVAGPGAQNMLRFSPQGNAMAYLQGVAPGAQVMVEPFPPDGSSVRVSQINEVGIRPVWSPDGGTLYYQVPADQAFQAVNISVPGFAMRNRRALPYNGAPNAHRIAVMPDGKLVLTIPQDSASGGGEGSELVIVENWIEEVKRRVPRE